MSNIQSQPHAIILAGGSGTRLWPLSRALFPKQLLALNNELSLLQETLTRTLTYFAPENIHVITNEEHVFEVREQARAIHENLEQGIVAEPKGRNTLPAILLGLDAAWKQEGGEVPPTIAVFPSDHMIHQVEQWGKSIAQATELAAQGWFVTFGIPPNQPETGYGYILRGEQLANDSYQVDRFVEKPNYETALHYVKDGRYLWNSGMFVFNGAALLRATEQHQPALWSWWQQRQTTPLLSAYGTLPSISVDYGIMEVASPIAVVEGDFGWDDLGSWEALYRLEAKDDKGCVLRGDTMTLECSNSMLLSRGGKLVGIGLTDIIAVQTRDATLICSRDSTQMVKDVVDKLKEEASPLTEVHLTVHRLWGSYTVLEERPSFKIKRITVNPGARLSLQMHHHRSEHWVVVSGTALVQINDEELLCTENQWAVIPCGARHRLTNPGKIPLELIEVQRGAYLEEDDIVRFDDVYGRKAND